MKKAVIGVHIPSYISGDHKWQGKLESLKKRLILKQIIIMSKSNRKTKFKLLSK